MPSRAIISLRVVDEDGRPMPAQDVSFYLDKGYFVVGEESSATKTTTVMTDDDGVASIVFACSVPGFSNLDANPGEANLVVLIGDQTRPTDVLPFRVNIVGRPAFITLTASPSEVVPGEAVTVLATVSDALNQNVPDGTEVRFTATPEGRLTNEIAPTLGGVAMTYLLTSNSGPGIYTIVASTADVTSLVKVEAHSVESSRSGV